jgi:hypothetical protein
LSFFTKFDAKSSVFSKNLTLTVLTVSFLCITISVIPYIIFYILSIYIAYRRCNCHPIFNCKNCNCKNRDTPPKYHILLYICFLGKEVSPRS